MVVLAPPPTTTIFFPLLYPTWQLIVLQGVRWCRNKYRFILMNRKRRQLGLYLPSRGAGSPGALVSAASSRGSSFSIKHWKNIKRKMCCKASRCRLGTALIRKTGSQRLVRKHRNSSCCMCPLFNSKILNTNKSKDKRSNRWQLISHLHNPYYKWSARVLSIIKAVKAKLIQLLLNSHQFASSKPFHLSKAQVLSIQKLHPSWGVCNRNRRHRWGSLTARPFKGRIILPFNKS